MFRKLASESSSWSTLFCETKTVSNNNYTAPIDWQHRCSCDSSSRGTLGQRPLTDAYQNPTGKLRFSWCSFCLPAFPKHSHSIKHAVLNPVKETRADCNVMGDAEKNTTNKAVRKNASNACKGCRESKIKVWLEYHMSVSTLAIYW